MLKFLFPILVVGCLLTTGERAAAQPPVGREADATDFQREDYYRQQELVESRSRAIIQQKAQFRSLQRQVHRAMLSWYGMSNSRPTAAPTPFTSIYSPVWQTRGGRPFSWHSSNQPAYVYVSEND